MAEETLEKKVEFKSPFDLGELAIQVAAGRYSMPQFHGDASHPEYVDVAIKNLEDSVKDSGDILYEVAAGNLRIAQEQAKVNARLNKEVYQLNPELTNYFDKMKKGYGLTFENSKLEDLNNALMKLGYGGEKLVGDDKLTVKEILEKGNAENASEQDRNLAYTIAYISSALIDLARSNLTSYSINNTIANLNKALKPKEIKEAEDAEYKEAS